MRKSVPGFTSRPRQQPLTEASTGVDHTSASLTTQTNLARMAPAQLVVFIEKQAGECTTPSPSKERNWRQKGPAPCCVCTCGERSKHFIEDMNFETRQRCGTCPPPK